MEPTIIGHLHEMTLDPESHWVKMMDLMGREYLLDPQVALELAIWVAEHYEAIAVAQAKLDAARRMEETMVYGSLLSTSASEVPVDQSSEQPRSSSRSPLPRKPRRRLPRTPE